MEAQFGLHALCVGPQCQPLSAAMKLWHRYTHLDPVRLRGSRLCSEQDMISALKTESLLTQVMLITIFISGTKLVLRIKIYEEVH
jgi:hypothetical protein